MRLLSALLLLLSPLLASALNILIYSTSIGHSHLKFHAKLADVLVEAGHHVVTLLSEQNPNVKMVSTHSEVITVPISEETKAIQDAGEQSTLVGFWVSDYEDIWGAVQVFKEITEMADAQCKKTLTYPGLLDRLGQHHFDVALSEPWDMCGFGLFHLLGIEKYAMTMTNHLSESVARLLGVPVMPSWVPGVEMGTGDDMDIGERFRNLQAAYISNEVSDTLIETQQNTFDTKYGEFPRFKELLGNSSLVFTNTDPLLDFPRPTLHKVVDLGGISVPPASHNLSAEWEEVLSRRPRTVLVSFGTIAKAFAMPDEYKSGLLSAFEEFPEVTFIMKYERPEDGLAAGHDNLVLTKWMPQTQLLSDVRVAVLVSHCGAGSVNEAAARGVPIVAIPLFFDQMRNAKMMERAGMAVRLHKRQLKEKEALTAALRELIDGRRYKQRAHEVAAMLSDRPFTPQELLVRNVEFLAKHGPLTNLDPHARKMGWMTYYNLDIFGLFVSAVFFVLLALAVCLCLGCFLFQQRKTHYRRCQDDDFFLHS